MVNASECRFPSVVVDIIYLGCYLQCTQATTAGYQLLRVSMRYIHYTVLWQVSQNYFVNNPLVHYYRSINPKLVIKYSYHKILKAVIRGNIAFLMNSHVFTTHHINKTVH